MAEKTGATEKKKSRFNLKRISRFFREYRSEFKKIVWPTKKETRQFTLVVFAFVVVMAIFLGLVDKTLEWVLYDLILGWRK